MKTVIIKGVKFELNLKLTPDTTIGDVKQLVLDHLVQSRSDDSSTSITSIILRCLGKELIDESSKLGGFKNEKLIMFAKEIQMKVYVSPKKRKLCINDCGFYGEPETNDAGYY